MFVLLFSLCPCFLLSMFCFLFFVLSPFVLSFLHSRILAFSLSLALAPLAPLVPLVPLVPVALWPLAIFVDRTFSDKNLVQVLGGDRTNCGE